MCNHPGMRADDGCRLWATAAGDGPPLVLCHGGPGMWDYFEDLAVPLRETSRVVRWDQRGCGRSARRGPYSVDRSVADLDAVREQLAGPRTAVLGHSWGAHLALRYALDHPDRVSHLIYVSGTGIDADRAWHPHYERELRRRTGGRTADGERERAVLRWSADFADPAAAPVHAERMATPWFGINYECNAAIGADVKGELGTELAGRCRRLDVPVLIVDGDADIRPRWAVDSLHAALPRVERLSLAGAGHVPWVERRTDFLRAITTFLGTPERRR
jgi:proline iminopeptidase